MRFKNRLLGKKNTHPTEICLIGEFTWYGGLILPSSFCIFLNIICVLDLSFSTIRVWIFAIRRGSGWRWGSYSKCSPGFSLQK